MSAPTLNELTRHAATIPSLPEVINYLMRTLSDERADVDTLAQHINSDPAIVGRLLAAANSAASGLSSPVFSAKQAFLVLGADRVVKIILASALAYRYDIRGNGFDARMLWRHSIGVATCAQTLAEHHGQISTEIAFTSGLLHDIGQMLMYVGSPTEYLQVLKTHQDEDLPLIECERTVFGFDHANAGEALARTWKLPEGICEAIGAHHEPDGLAATSATLSMPAKYSATPWTSASRATTGCPNSQILPAPNSVSPGPKSPDILARSKPVTRVFAVPWASSAPPRGQAPNHSTDSLDRKAVVGIYAEIAGDGQRLAHDILRIKIRIFD